MRLILWLGIAVASPLMYTLVALIMWATGYSPASSWTFTLPVFAAFGASEVGGIIVLRQRLEASPSSRPDSRQEGLFVGTLALTDAIALEGLVAYLALGSVATLAVMVSLAAISALVTRPTD